jgi:hypothetical protein
MLVRTARPRTALSTSIYILKHGGPPVDGGHPGGRRTGGHPGGGGRADTPAGGGQAGAMLRMGYMLTPWGKGGHGRTPNAEAGKTHQQKKRS